MKRICVIGNSHIAAIKQAWDELAPDHPGLKMSFFASGGMRLKDLKADDGKLAPSTQYLTERFYSDTGEKAIDPSQYDVFILVALGYGLTHIIFTALDYRADSMNTGLSPYKHLVSDACFKEAATDKLDGMAVTSVLRELRSLTDKPVILLAQPLPSARKLYRCKTGQFKDIVNYGDKLMDIWLEYGRKLSKDYRIKIVYQHPVTVKERFFTRGKFSGGVHLSEKLDDYSRPAPPADMHHMNTNFGKLMIKSAMRHMGY